MPAGFQFLITIIAVAIDYIGLNLLLKWLKDDDDDNWPMTGAAPA